MKKKIPKILGIVVTLALLLAMFPAPLAAQAPVPSTPNMWVNVQVPGPGGQVVPAAAPDCNLIAVGPDGTTIYAVDNQSNTIYKSVNGGRSWIVLTLPPALAGAFPMIDMAVAPDTPDVVGVVDGSAAPRLVWVSSNGGATWAGMPTLVGIVTGGTSIQSIDVSPSVPWGREYAVSTANLADGAAAGDVIIYGTGPNPMGWANQAAPAMDYTSCSFTPGYAGYRVVLAVGSDVTATANDLGTAGDSWLHIRNTSEFPPVNWNAGQGFIGYPVRLDTATADSPGAATIVGSGIAVPSDYDPSTGGSRRAYVRWNAGGAVNDDIYRVDNVTVNRCNVMAGGPVQLASMAYTGTLNEGTMIVGQVVGTQVRRSSDPFSALPTWAPSVKPPSSGVVAASGNVQVALHPDFATNSIIYAGTSGAAVNDQSAFNMSSNGGVSFNQLSLIDTVIAAHMDITPTPNGDVLFLATSDGVALDPDSLWRSTTSPLGTGWERVATMVCDAATAVVRVDPNYAETSAVYFAEIGGVANFNILYSANGGDTFASRFAPAAVIDLLVENKDTCYAALAAGNVRKSTSSGWTWGLPKASRLVGITMLNIASNGDIFASGAGRVSYSQDGGNTFTIIVPGIGGAAAATYVVPDKGYETNNIIFAAEATAAGGGIFRWTIGTSSAWQPIRPGGNIGVVPGTGTINGLVMRGDAIYAAWDTAGAAPSGMERSLCPDCPNAVVGLTFMATLLTGLPAATVQLNNPPQALKVSGAEKECSLWAIDTAAAVGAGVFVFNDSLALAAPSFNMASEVFSDPATGRNDSFTATWAQVSNSLAYDFRIYTDSRGTEQVLASARPAFFPGWGAAAPGWVPPNPAGPAIVIAAGVLISGRTYYARMRVRGETTLERNWTNWSKMKKFEVMGGEIVTVPYLGPQPLGPAIGATGVSAANPALTWAPYARATKYRVKLCTDSALTDIVAVSTTETTAYQYEGALEYNTTYFWAVRAIEPTLSDWSPTANFTTAGPPVTKPYTCPECGLSFATEKELADHYGKHHPTYAPTPPSPPPPAQPAMPAPIDPGYLWAIIIIGAILVIALIVLIVRTRRVV